MSVTAFNEIADGRGMREADNGAREYVRVFEAQTDDAQDNAATVLAASAMPQRGTPYSDGNATDFGAFVVRRDIQSSGGRFGKLWTVTVTYSNLASETGDVFENPLDEPPERSVSFIERTKTAEFDRLGESIVNTAGHEFPEQPEIEDAIPQITVIRNEAGGGFAFQRAIDYTNAVNEDAFELFNVPVEPRQALFAAPSLQELTRNRTTYLRITYRIKLNPDTWDIEIASRGYVAKEITQTTIFVNSSDVIQLNELGEDVQGSERTGTSTPAELTFEPYKFRNFGALNL